MRSVIWRERAEQHLGRGAVRAALAEVVLDRPDRVEAERSAELDLLDRLVVGALLALALAVRDAARPTASGRPLRRAGRASCGLRGSVETEREARGHAAVDHERLAGDAAGEIRGRGRRSRPRRPRAAAMRSSDVGGGAADRRRSAQAASMRGVRTAPGTTAFTRMPCGHHSSAIVFTSAEQAGLGRAVGAVARGGEHAAHRGHRDDRAAACPRRSSASRRRGPSASGASG